LVQILSASANSILAGKIVSVSEMLLTGAFWIYEISETIRLNKEFSKHN